MKKSKKHLKHVCANCWYYADKGLNTGICLNCDCPGDIRNKKPNDICDGGGRGSDDFGFVPCER